MTGPTEEAAAGSLDCRAALELLQDHLKRELTPELVTVLEQHLHACRDCFRNAEFERSFIAMLAAKASGQCCPERVRERVLAALAAERGHA